MPSCLCGYTLICMASVAVFHAYRGLLKLVFMHSLYVFIIYCLRFCLTSKSKYLHSITIYKQGGKSFTTDFLSLSFF